MGAVFVGICAGGITGCVVGFFLGYAWSESNVADKISSFAADVYADSLEFKNDIKREIRELKDDIKK